MNITFFINYITFFINDIYFFINYVVSYHYINPVYFSLDWIIFNIISIVLGLRVPAAGVQGL